MNYLLKKDVKEVIKKLIVFEGQLQNLYSQYGIILGQNTGRRNQILSPLQEKELANQLRKRYVHVTEDGRPGQPDIFIGDITKELECKLTSGTKSGKSIAYSLQTDYETLVNKGKLDYLYIISNREFTKFCALHFIGLTSDDFHFPAAGSRGKARMKKSVAMKKCKVLYGGIINRKEKMISNYQDKIDELIDQSINETYNCLKEHKAKNSSTLVCEKEIAKIEERYDKKIDGLKVKQKLWESKKDSYSFTLESFEEE